MKTHKLKTLPAYFDAVERGDKTFELRNNDRDFQAGDVLLLEEFDPTLIRISPPWPAGSRPPEHAEVKDHDGYTGRRLTAIVSYVLHDTWEKFGLQRGYVCLGLADVKANGRDAIGDD